MFVKIYADISGMIFHSEFSDPAYLSILIWWISVFLLILIGMIYNALVLICIWRSATEYQGRKSLQFAARCAVILNSAILVFGFPIVIFAFFVFVTDG